MSREQLDLLIKYINLKVQIATSRFGGSPDEIDELVLTLKKLEDSCPTNPEYRGRQT